VVETQAERICLLLPVPSSLPLYQVASSEPGMVRMHEQYPDGLSNSTSRISTDLTLPAS
jgi:hypothetical protein